MCPIPYYMIKRRSKDPQYLRFEMARRAQEQGIKPTARQFNTTPKTVRKWLKRWTPGTLQGLQDQSRAPQHPFRRIPPAQRKKALDLKRQLPSWGAQRIKRDYALPISEKAIRQIWRQEGLLKRRRKKHQTKNDLRAVKAAWKLFAQTCIDTKDLIDIPELWPQIRKLNLPRVQYTAREVVSGLHFIAYAQERSLANSRLFGQILIDHLQHCRVNLQQCRFQTDNGSEFIGSWQADVETAHRLIEDEFYQIEPFLNRSDFLAKAATYNLWFNTTRKNSYKENKTPWEIIHERDPSISPSIVTLPPFFLDELLNQKLDSPKPRGYDLIPHPSD